MPSPFTPPSLPGGAGMPLGLAGATAATRYVGATASGAPTTGTFQAGDFVVAQDGSVWVCTAAGSPGTWTQIGAGGGGVAPPADFGFGLRGDEPIAPGAANFNLVPVYVPVAFTTTGVGYAVGTASGHAQFGLWTAAGSRIATVPSFLVPGADAQRANWSAPVALSVGWYWAGMQVDNATITLGFVLGSPWGMGGAFPNTYGSGVPATLPAISRSRAVIGLCILA